MRLLVCLISLVIAGEVNIFPKLASELEQGDGVLLGDEVANITDISLNDDGSLTIIGMGLITSEFFEKEIDPSDVIDVSPIEISTQKVNTLDENDFVVLEDSDGKVTEDAEISPKLREKLASALKMKETVKARVVYSFGIRRVTDLFIS